MRLKNGDKVHYTAPHGAKENGIIKSISDDGDMKLAFVVYHCDDDWENYENYTGAATELDSLTIGWMHDVNIKEYGKAM